MGIVTPFGGAAGFVFVFAVSGGLASLAGAGFAFSLEGRPDWETTRALLAICVLCCGALGLLRLGRISLAAWTLMLTGVGGVTTLMTTGNTRGFDDIAVMLYAVLAIAASVLLDSKSFAFSQILVVSSLALVFLGELRASGETGADVSSHVADGAFAILIVVVTGVGSHFLANSLRRSTRERERDQEALARANLELESRALERERLIRELEMRNSELERFAYTISHELKSPLVTIGGFLPMYKESTERGDGAAAERHYGRVREAHERMRRLLSELLELCRLGFLHDPAEEVRLDEVVEEARAAAETALSETGVEVEVSARLPRLRGDRPRLVEVFQNLLENAARFTRAEPEPRVEISVREDAGHPVVVVCDNGIGIAPAHHEKVFELFHKLDASDRGTGIGLAIVRRIVELHEGKIWVESEGEGQGAAFCISLPWAPEEDAGQVGTRGVEPVDGPATLRHSTTNRTGGFRSVDPALPRQEP